MDHGSYGVSEKHFWWAAITPEELRDPHAIERRYLQAVAGGLVTHSENDRLAFFRWAHHCDRTGENPPALFNYGLRHPDRFDQRWDERGSPEDEDWARVAIAYLRQADCGENQELLADLADAFSREADQ